MPKSLTLLLRRWPCWPGPYSRRLTGLFGRPKTFSPIRRSSLYLALLRLLICSLQFACPPAKAGFPIEREGLLIPEPHRPADCAERGIRFTGGAEPIASRAHGRAAQESQPRQPVRHR